MSGFATRWGPRVSRRSAPPTLATTIEGVNMVVWTRRSEPRLRAAQPAAGAINGLVIEEPTRSGHVKAKAMGGPCAGAKIDAHPNWDGIVMRKGTIQNPARPHPGRYVLHVGPNGAQWVWEPSGKSTD